MILFIRIALIILLILDLVSVLLDIYIRKKTRTSLAGFGAASIKN